MRQFASFVRKEFCHILRDKRTLLILLVMPVIQIILFGFAISTDIRNIKIAILDSSQDNVTSYLIRQFEANKYFSVEKLVTSQREIDELFRQNKIDMVVVFENNFSRNIVHDGKASVQLIADGSNPNTATMAVNYASSIFMDYQLKIAQNMNGAASVSQFAAESTTSDIGGTTSVAAVTSSGTVTIIPTVKMLYNPQMKAAYNFVPGVMGLILMLICTMMTSIAIVREKEHGTMEVLLVSPVKPLSIIISKTIPYLVISFINLITIILLAVFVLGVPVSGSMSWLLAISTLFIFVSLSMGMLISTLVKTQAAAMLTSGLVMMMPGMLLSGLMFPVENMPWILQFVSIFVPARWYISAVKTIMIEGSGIAFAAKEVYILLAMAAVFITASLKRFKNRLE
ncbi:MAG: ABC transporter permease [Bacteroidales bacterium]|nr:ABC transporter permease [Bacteroidales bacterium]MDD4669772.1 ABC transporter permease [Bacteroidales bacterium]